MTEYNERAQKVVSAGSSIDQEATRSTQYSRQTIFVSLLGFEFSDGWKVQDLLNRQYVGQDLVFTKVIDLDMLDSLLANGFDSEVYAFDPYVSESTRSEVVERIKKAHKGEHMIQEPEIITEFRGFEGPDGLVAKILDAI